MRGDGWRSDPAWLQGGWHVPDLSQPSGVCGLGLDDRCVGGSVGDACKGAGRHVAIGGRGSISLTLPLWSWIMTRLEPECPIRVEQGMV